MAGTTHAFCFANGRLLLLLGAALAPLSVSSAVRADPTPLKAEADVWALVQRVGTADAYLTYTNRFRGGPHFEDARKAYLRSIGLPIGDLVAPPAPPPPPRRMAVQMPVADKTPATDPCVTLMVGDALGKTRSA